MIRLATLFWLLLVSATGAVMFTVKYQVQALDDALAQTRNAAAQEQHEIRMLTAEWAYLNRPDTLAAMNQRYLSLGPIATRQLQTAIADIPLRPPPAAPAAAEVAAAVAAPWPDAPSAPSTVPRVEPIPPPPTLDSLFARIAAGGR
jgi:hypothetical protein